MKVKTVLISILSIGLLIIVGARLYPQKDHSEQQVLQSTYDHSKEYLSLRYRTDNILINAENYSDYSSWDGEMTALIADWKTFESKASALEEAAAKEAAETALKLDLGMVAHAYTAKEINDIYDKAPKFKGIATLAKHLGVDAKRAQLILNQAQNETTAEGWTEAGDTLQKLETSAVVIKDGCKVAGFVGGVVLTGGAAGLATAGTLTTTTTVVVGVDLALEITEDGSQIAFGDNNKVSSFVGGVRTVTEPIANVLTITNIPSNLGTAFGKIDSVMIGLEQFRESAQEGKVIGVDLTNFEYHPPFQVIRQTKYPGEVSVVEMEKAEVEAWLESLNKKPEPLSQKEVEDFLKPTPKEAEQVEKIVEEKVESGEVVTKKETPKNTADNTNQILKIVNVSGSSFMMDTCFTSACWDDLAANPAEDRDVGGIYTMGKVFGNGESFRTGFRPSDLKASNRLVESSDNSYKITLYFAIAPFDGPKNKMIEYGTWLSESVEINAKYGDEPVIEWDGSALRQVK